MDNDKSIKGMVIIPMLRALVTGVLVALFTSSWFIGPPPWRMFFVILAGAALVSWLAVILPNKKILTRVSKSKVYPVETTTIQITASDPAGQFAAGRWADLPISHDSMESVAKRLQHGGSFSHASLAGPGRPLSRSQYEVLRDEFIARGLAYWINPDAHSQGVELTRAGRAVMRHFQGNSTVTLEPIPQLQEKVTVPLPLSSAAHAHKDTRDNGKEVLLRD